MAGDSMGKFLWDVGVWYSHKGWVKNISMYPQEHSAGVIAGTWEHRSKPGLNTGKKMSDVSAYCQGLQDTEEMGLPGTLDLGSRRRTEWLMFEWWQSLRSSSPVFADTQTPLYCSLSILNPYCTIV